MRKVLLFSLTCAVFLFSTLCVFAYETIIIKFPSKELWVKAYYKKVGNEQILKLSIEKMYEQIANNEIESIMEKTRKLLGIAPEDYRIAEMDKIW